MSPEATVEPGKTNTELLPPKSRFTLARCGESSVLSAWCSALCLRDGIQDAVSPPWVLLKEAMSDDRTVGPSASEVVVNWGQLVLSQHKA